MMKALIWHGTRGVRPFALLLLIAVICAWLFWPGNGPYRKTLDPAAVLIQVRALNELVTVKYTVQKVVGIKEKREPLGSESILLLVQARVLAGVDLAGLTPDDVIMPSREEARIRLQPAHILETFIEEKETKVWDRRVTWWTPWVAADPDLEHKARLDALEQVRSTAVEMGILKDARKNAERDIRAILQAFGITKVVFLPTVS